VVTVYRDAGGSLLGGNLTCVDSLRPGTTSLQSDPIEPLPGLASAELYVAWQSPAAPAPYPDCA
jgi:hypothetical protein